MGGAEGAAFVACALLELQDSPVDEACFYAGDTNLFGLFNVYGAPRKTFFAFRAFRCLLDAPIRLEATGGEPGALAVAAGASADRSAVTILAANLRSDRDAVRLVVRGVPWQGPGRVEARRLDADHDLDPIPVEPDGESRWIVPLRGPAVVLIRLGQPPAE
jgi:hypothetical protein